MRSLACLFLAPCLCAAAEAPSPDLVIGLTRSISGEFAAGALIRLASLESLDKPKRISLLEEAFRRGAESREPLKRRPAITRVPGAAGFLGRAFAQEFDVLSLRVRAIEALESLDAGKARALFLSLSAPRVPRLTCTDFLAYDVSGYYRLLPRFAPPPRVAAEAGAITSPVEIAPLAQAILQAVRDDDFAAQLSAFRTALAAISNDDRSFAWERNLGPDMLALVDACKRRHISPLPLLESYRLYLINNEQANRCADDDLMIPTEELKVSLSTGLPVIGGEGVAFFNSKLRAAPLQPIQERETLPAKLEGVAEGLQSCRDSPCRALAEQYNALISDRAHKNSMEWTAQARKLMEALSRPVPGSSVTPAQDYRERTSLYLDLLALAPPGPLQEEVIISFVVFIEKSSFRDESRAEWFLPVNALIGRMGLDPLGVGRYAAHLRQSKDSVIATYSALEAVAPRPPAAILALM